ncbi:MAG: hypothetical protein R3Y22_08075 [Bacteroidales bacterium]
MAYSNSFCFSGILDRISRLQEYHRLDTPVLIFMSYAPDKFKNKEFYAGLFDYQMSAEDIDLLKKSLKNLQR